MDRVASELGLGFCVGLFTGKIVRLGLSRILGTSNGNCVILVNFILLNRLLRISPLKQCLDAPKDSPSVLSDLLCGRKLWVMLLSMAHDRFPDLKLQKYIKAQRESNPEGIRTTSTIISTKSYLYPIIYNDKHSLIL
jgi:hypothetical protein